MKAQHLNAHSALRKHGGKRPGAGAPSKYRSEFVVLARKLCEAGATDEELAREIGVDRKTLQAWRAKYPEFAEACAIGKGIADQRVVSSLYERAVGYDYDEEQAFCTRGGLIKKTTVRKHEVPNVTAQIFWLKNRDPRRWRDVQTLDVAPVIDLSALSDEQLDQLQRISELLAPKRIGAPTIDLDSKREGNQDLQPAVARSEKSARS